MAETQLDGVDRIRYQASLREGGWKVTLRMKADWSPQPYMPLRINQTDYWSAGPAYGLKLTSWAGDASRNTFQGHVIRADKTASWNEDAMIVVAAGAQALMRDLEMRTLEWREAAAPSGDNEFVTMRHGDIAKALIEDYTTLTDSPGLAYTTAGIVTTGIGSTYSFWTTPQSNLWRIIKQLADINAWTLWCSKDKHVVSNQHSMFQSPLPSIQVALDNSWWYSINAIERQDRTRQVRLEGYTDGSQAGEQDEPLRSVYPASPTIDGPIVKKTIACNDQAELDDIAERMYRMGSLQWVVNLSTWHWPLWLELEDRVTLTYSDADIGFSASAADYYVDAIDVTLENTEMNGWVCAAGTLRLIEGN